ncbi:MAG: M14-type cytosolic carboxypeptidase [Candidatus Cyclobacteriaceae bacterium M3_2C_046]
MKIKSLFLIFIITGLAILNPEQVQAQKISVHTDFEGGSALVTYLDQESQTIHFVPGGDSLRGWPNWWYFRVDGAKPGTTLNIKVDDPAIGFWATPDRAFYSINGKDWHHTSKGERQDNSITYQQKVDNEQVWLAWGPPFLHSDAQELVKKLAEYHPDEAKDFPLGQSRENRMIPALKVASGSDKNYERPVIWIQTRQHAWETGSSWVGKGFIEWLLSEEKEAVWLRESTEIYFVPVMDVDNVVTGDGGKMQQPHDHNRDWSDDPYFPAVVAAQKYLKEFIGSGRLQIFIDLHNPGTAKTAYFYTPLVDSMDEKTRHSINAFAAVCEKNIREPVQFDSRLRHTNIQKQPRWNYTSYQWVVRVSDPGVIGVTMEVAWNNPGSTTEGYQRVGQQLGRSITAYFKKCQ